MPDATIDAFVDHGTVARTVDADLSGAAAILGSISDAGVDIEDVAQTLEDQGVASFTKSFDDLIATLTTKAASF